MRSIIKFSKIMEEKKLPFKFWIGPYPVIVVSDPEDVRAITTTFAEKPYFYKFGRDFVGDGLLSAPASIWKHNIKKLGGTFTGTVVGGYQDIFNAQAQKLVQKLKTDAGKEPIDALHKYIAMTTLEAICETALGASDDMTEDLVSLEYHKAFRRGQELIVDRLMTLPYHLDFIYHLTPAHKELMTYKDLMHGLSEKMIQKRRRERQELKINGTFNSSETTTTKFRPFLDVLLDIQDADPTVSDDYIKSEVFTIIMGGQDTVATALSFTLLMLGSYPHIQDKLYAEIKELFGDSKRPLTTDDLARLSYCEAVIKETLRLYPPAPFVIRDSDRDLQLKSCLIPKGTGCGVCIWGTGRLKSTWGEDAEQFKPERWFEEGCPEMSPSFIPFSFGKRVCIGKKYAFSILKTILTYCIRELEFESDISDLVLKLEITMKASRGNLLKVRFRDDSK
ncbi:cytochrome P450 4V2-like isoform X2 [Pectinophora gossypiella]|nr:cytochrome P450 4V2-like isoform X2 [Pectinophora gossypiella]